MKKLFPCRALWMNCVSRNYRVSTAYSSSLWQGEGTCWSVAGPINARLQKEAKVFLKFIGKKPHVKGGVCWFFPVETSRWLIKLLPAGKGREFVSQEKLSKVPVCAKLWTSFHSRHWSCLSVVWNRPSFISRWDHEHCCTRRLVSSLVNLFSYL